MGNVRQRGSQRSYLKQDAQVLLDGFLCEPVGKEQDGFGLLCMRYDEVLCGDGGTFQQCDNPLMQFLSTSVVLFV